MIIVNKIENQIVVSCVNKEYVVLHTTEKFNALMKISDQSETVSTMQELQELLTHVEAICKDDFKQRVESFHPDLFVSPHTNKFYLRIGDKVSSVEIPTQLVDRIERSMEKNISVDPIIKCWKRFLRNKKANDAEFAARFCEYINMIYVDPRKVKEFMDQGLGYEIASEKAKTYEVKITQEGLLACYKTSNEYLDTYTADEDGNPKRVDRYKKRFNADTGEIEGDDRDDIPVEQRIFVPYIMGHGGDAFYCEGPNGYTKPGHFIKVGCTHRLPDWSYVNCNDEESCVKGLHIGGLSYIASWNGADIHTCFVDPMHIGAIPDYSNDKAIRVLQYYVYGSLVSINHNIYHSSKYAAQTDVEWNNIAQQILNDFGTLIEEVNEERNELLNL